MVKKIEFPSHVLFWLFSLWLLNQNFAFVTQDIYFIDGRRHEVVSRNYQLLSLLMVTVVGKMAAVYGHACWALPQFLRKRRPLRYAAYLALLIAAGVVLEITAVHFLARRKPDISLAGWAQMWQLNALLYGLYLGISVAYVMGKHWQRHERIRRQLQHEKLAAELNFLKAQINPHFLFNTLNNLFALAERHRNHELAAGIAGLSDLMRYMLYECRADRVPLLQEVHFIRALIELQQLRLGRDDEVVIAFDVDGALDDRYIAPMVLLPFVENAFKHGIRWQQHSFIKIRLQVSGEKLDFQVLNSTFAKPQPNHPTATGLGLANVHRRLELTYPDRHELAITEQPGRFAVRLALVL